VNFTYIRMHGATIKNNSSNILRSELFNPGHQYTQISYLYFKITYFPGSRLPCRPNIEVASTVQRSSVCHLLYVTILAPKISM